MAAPKGNKFWERRSKHGKSQLFASPELFWKAACEYFEWSLNNPLIEVEQVKVPGKAVRDDEGTWIFPPNLIELPKMRALTLKALCLYLNCHSTYFQEFRERWIRDKSKKNKEIREQWLTVIGRIEDTIFVQKFEGAAAGFLKESIIARELGLADKQEHKHDGNIANTFSGKVEVVHRSSGIPLGNNPSDEQESR